MCTAETPWLDGKHVVFGVIEVRARSEDDDNVVSAYHTN